MNNIKELTVSVGLYLIDNQTSKTAELALHLDNEGKHFNIPISLINEMKEEFLKEVENLNKTAPTDETMKN